MKATNEKVAKATNESISSRKPEFFEPVKSVVKPWRATSKQDKKEIEEAFPIVDPGITPFSDRVIFQLRTPVKKTRSGLITTDQDAEAQLWNEQVARVVAIGPTAFYFQKDGSPWPEGPWFKVGDFVRVPVHRTERWKRENEAKEEGVFIIQRAFEVIALIHCNPLEIINRAIGVL